MPSSENTSIAIANEWLNELVSASKAADISAFVNSFLPMGWLRDLLCFSWDFRTLSGQTMISNFLSEPVGKQTRFAAAGFYNFALDISSSIGPPKKFEVPGNPDAKGLQGAFTYSIVSPPAVGRGYFRIVEGEGGWKALTVLTSLNDLIGHEESVERPFGAYNRHMTATRDEIRDNEVETIEKDPTVVIIGGGQTGLMCAARLKRLGIRTLVVEKTPRIGDVWRNRYPTLTLHTTAKHCSLIYQPWPENYPKYIPKEILADFLEIYAQKQDICIWLSSTVLPVPTYDPSTCRWSVPIDHAGKKVVLNPKHIIMANGNATPNIPKFRGIDSFRGAIYHSADHKGADSYGGKRVIVVGASVSAGDMCIDFVSKGASEVTMVQRGPICVASQFTNEKIFLSRYAEDGPVEDMDFISNSMPCALVLQLAAAGGTQRVKALDKNMLDGLRKAGYKLTWEVTPGGGEVGVPGFIFEKGSAETLMDVGSSQLIIDGKVKMQGVEIEEIVHDGVVFQDGTKILADIIVLATGYKPFIQNAIDIFGENITKKVGAKIWGIDGEGEPQAAYRPTGQPGLWFAFGAFHSARFFSKHLALQILAQELGLTRA